ncbi:MAG TPA: glycosyltransferase [Isosphaeraceae bacterium]
MRLAVSFTNLGPYHLARLRALGSALTARAHELIVYETAGRERRYPWARVVDREPFERITLFPEADLEGLSDASCRGAILRALAQDRPDALGIVGYSRPESMAMLRWARREGKPTVLMSESQEIDHPRLWWKEAIKRRRVSRFSAALVGGPQHAEYLTLLGLPAERIAFGYNAVDNDRFARLARETRCSSEAREGLPSRPYFLAVNRFVPEKNLPRLVNAFARYRMQAGADGWDLVLCGSGPDEAEIRSAISASGVASSIHCPGFVQADGLARWLAHASAFVHPSLSEPWGLVVNEAAVCGLPLLISERAGCVETLVPEPFGSTGRRFDPTSETDITDGLAWMVGLSESSRQVMGRRAAEVVSEWGPERFARGMLEALDHAFDRERRRSLKRTEVAR